MSSLQDLLNKVGTYHPMYGDRLAMHLPMVLIALSKLDASDEKLRETFEQNLDELEATPKPAYQINQQTFTQHLGDTNAYASYLQYFHTALDNTNTEQVLTDTLPMLIPGLAASAFHAMIRLAYAIEKNHQGEIAIALAFWSAEYQAFQLNSEKTTDSLPDILHSVVEMGMNYSFGPGIIVDHMNEVAALLQAEQRIIQPAQISLNDVRRFALTAFYSKDEFTLLHTVTGCHAFSKLLPFIDNEIWAVRELWQAILVAYLSTGLPFNPKAIPQEEIHENDFEPLRKLALQLEDSHDIKLFYTCYSEFLSNGESGYYSLAKRIFRNVITN